MRKRALAIFVALLACPLAGHATVITSTFLGSTTGTSAISVGNTIQFEVSVDTTTGFEYGFGSWSLSGDVEGALGSSLGSGWAGVDNFVIDWSYNYIAGFGTVDMSLADPVTPEAVAAPPGEAQIVSHTFGFIEPSETSGTGIVSLVGTVTIRANAAGTFIGGGFLIPGANEWGGSSGLDTVGGGGGPFTSGATGFGGIYTVVPEPGTVSFIAFGLVAIGAMTRRNHRKGS